jgi:proline iminopeptidase
MNRSAKLALPLLLMVLYASHGTPGYAQRVSPPVREGYINAGGGVRLFYRTVGTGRDTMVVLHGGPGLNLNYLAADLEPLAGRHTLIFYDQRGAGRSSLVSDSVGLDAQRFAEDLEAVRRHFRLARLTMMGHSWGAAVAALYAVRYPERVGRILIVDGIPLRGAETEQAFARLDASRDSVTRRRMQELMKARRANPGDANVCRAYYILWFQPFYGDTAAARREKGDFCSGTTEARRNKMASVDRFTMSSLGNWDWRPLLRAVKAPALVIHGTMDVLPVQSARAWAAALPNSRLLLLNGVGHFPYVEAPERFFPAVEAFLQGRWPEGAEAAGTVDAIRNTTSVVSMITLPVT